MTLTWELSFKIDRGDRGDRHKGGEESCRDRAIKVAGVTASGKGLMRTSVSIEAMAFLS